MSKAFTYIVVAIMALVLLIFTASRTLDLLQTFLPAGQSAFAYLGLVAFDGGLLGWSFFFAHGARGHWQRAVALIMVIVSLVAVGVSSIADLYLGAANKGLLASLGQQQRVAILLAVGGVIFLNIAAFFLVHITDPERLREMAKENTKDIIHAETLRQMNAAAAPLAARIAPHRTQQWVEQVIQEMAPGVQFAPPPAPPDPKETLRLPAIRGSLQPGQNGNSAQQGGSI